MVITTHGCCNSFQELSTLFLLILIMFLQLRPEFSLCRVYKKSKSLRAFDRRPSPEVPMTGQEAMVHQVIAHHGTEATTSHHNRPTMERTGSPESSSNEDHPNPSNTMRSDNLDMDIGNEPLWDWEHLNWF